MTVRWAISGLGMVGACGPNLEKECLDFVDTVNTCIDEAFSDAADELDGAKAELDGWCDEYADIEGDAADEAAEVLDCETDAVAGGDCGDPAGYAAVFLKIQGCTSPLPF